MIGTESKLWMKMNEHTEMLVSLKRIESAITPGASDVEYVGLQYHGWIELKTAAKPRPGNPYTLHSEFTTAQSSWLLAHNNLEINLRSWLCLGILGPRTWREFILIDPSNAVALLKGRDGAPHELLRKRDGLRIYTTMRDLVRDLDT